MGHEEGARRIVLPRRSQSAQRNFSCAQNSLRRGFVFCRLLNRYNWKRGRRNDFAAWLFLAALWAGIRDGPDFVAALDAKSAFQAAAPDRSSPVNSRCPQGADRRESRDDKQNPRLLVEVERLIEQRTENGKNDSQKHPADIERQNEYGQSPASSGLKRIDWHGL
jgi:hypothetical protein